MLTGQRVGVDHFSDPNAEETWSAEARRGPVEKAPHPSSPGFSHFSQSPHLHFSLPTQTPWQPKPQSFPALGGESIKKYSMMVGGVSICFMIVSKVAEPQTPATYPFPSRMHTHTHTHTHTSAHTTSHGPGPTFRHLCSDPCFALRAICR